MSSEPEDAPFPMFRPIYKFPIFQIPHRKRNLPNHYLQDQNLETGQDSRFYQFTNNPRFFGQYSYKVQSPIPIDTRSASHRKRDNSKLTAFIIKILQRLPNYQAVAILDHYFETIHQISETSCRRELYFEIDSDSPLVRATMSKFTLQNIDNKC